MRQFSEIDAGSSDLSQIQLDARPKSTYVVAVVFESEVFRARIDRAPFARTRARTRTRARRRQAGPRPPVKLQTGAEKLIRCLEREGVEYIFGLSGGAAMPIFDALVDSKIKLILVRHEQGATHMADGYARATGKPGVVLVTSGPGRDQHGDGHADRADGLGADDRAHRPDHLADAGQGRLPGGGRHRHHLPGGEALATWSRIPNDIPRVATRGVPPRDDRAARARCSSTCPRT